MIWKILYSTKSSKHTGTLYAARNAINARNVTDEPGDNFYASTELVDKFDSAYIVCGGIHHFEMQSLDSEPGRHQYTGEIGNKKEMAEFVVSEAREFLDTLLSLDTPHIPVYGPQNNSLLCRFCNKKYKRPKKLRKHEAELHGVDDPLYNNSSAEQSETTLPNDNKDRVLEYTKAAILLGLMRKNHSDAIKMGDGQRIIDMNMYLCLLYKMNKCPKYAYGILETIAQSKVLLTPRLAHQLIWNRTVNHRGKPDTNHPNDLDIEHQNKLFKDQIHSYRGVYTEKAISRVSPSVNTVDKVLKAYDKSVDVFRPCGLHTSANTEQDVYTLIQSFQKAELFENKPGRVHKQFEIISSNLFESMDNNTLRDWISASLKKFSQEHFY